jgi:menaquinone-9 beta-reductase
VKTPKSYDVAVIGAGLAGGLSAYHLAARGLRTVLIEKETEAHHKVCGEFLSSESQPYLQEAGIDLFALGAAKISRMRLHGPHSSGEAELPRVAFGFSRFRLDAELIHRAKNAGAEVRLGQMALGLEDPGTEGEFEVLTAGESIFARSLIVGTGKFDFKTGRKRVGRDSGYVGFKMHLRLKPSVYQRIKNSVDLYVFEGGYGGLSPIEEGKANFCFVIRRSALREAGSTWLTLANYICKHNWQASRDLDGAVPLFDRAVSCPVIPYGFLRKRAEYAGIYHIGDQLAVIPSLTGDGMSIALDSARTVVDYVAHQSKLAARSQSFAYHSLMHRRLRIQLEFGFQLHKLFRQPKACDWAAAALARAPWLLKPFFYATRVRMGSSAPEFKYLKQEPQF